MKNTHKGNSMKTTKMMLLSVVATVALSTGVYATCASDVDMGGNTISNVADPVNNTDVVNKRFFYDTLKEGYIRDDSKEVVVQISTGLMWQDNVAAQTVTKRWLTELNYYKCTNNNTDCENTAGDTAATYCTDLSLGGFSDWRLPTKEELFGILKSDATFPSISAVFQHITSDFYWSSTIDNDYGAWGATFDYSNHSISGKNNSYYVRCVRAGQ